MYMYCSLLINPGFFPSPNATMMHVQDAKIAKIANPSSREGGNGSRSKTYVPILVDVYHTFIDHQALAYTEQSYSRNLYYASSVKLS